jgi:DNA-directed RNA polymerase subunit K/omega
MTDNKTAQLRVDSIYNYVLIASERVREIYRERAASGENALPIEEYKRLPLIYKTAAEDIESGRVGIEYLKKIKSRDRRSPYKMR